MDGGLGAQHGVLHRIKFSAREKPPEHAAHPTQSAPMLELIRSARAKLDQPAECESSGVIKTAADDDDQPVDITPSTEDVVTWKEPLTVADLPAEEREKASRSRLPLPRATTPRIPGTSLARAPVVGIGGNARPRLPPPLLAGFLGRWCIPMRNRRGDPAPHICTASPNRLLQGAPPCAR